MLTADHRAFLGRADIQPGSTVLVNGGSGAVGTAAVRAGPAELDPKAQWGSGAVGRATGRVGEDLSDRRVTAGILLAATSLGGDDLHPFAKANFPFMRPSFDELTTPTLVIACDHDQSKMSTRGPDWFTDAYTYSPGATDLLTFTGAEHGLGGIVGYEVAETTDENPEGVAVIQRMTTAYLRTALHVDEHSWAAARAAFGDSVAPIGRVDSKEHQLAAATR